MNAVPAPSGLPSDDQWLVHCSPERTLVARREGGKTTLVKLFEQGSLLDAQQETDLAHMLAQAGLVPYTRAEIDPITSKPCVRMPFFEGTNLERHIALEGPMRAPVAIRLMARLTQVLANLHDTSHAGAPHGVIHRDVKPANVFLATGSTEEEAQPVLIDLEHVTLRQPGIDVAPGGGGFTGGTHGHSPPEAYEGIYPNPAFDVFGLGTTLFYILTGSSPYPQVDVHATASRVRQGCTRLALLRGQPKLLQTTVARCLAVEPGVRPTAAELLDVFAELENQNHPTSEILDLALIAVQSGEFAAADEHLEAAGLTPGHDASRHHQLIHLASIRSRLLTRIGGTPEVDLPIGEDKAKRQDLARLLGTELPRVNNFLRRFPLHTETLQLRQRMLAAGHRLLEDVLPDVASLKLEARFDDAKALLDAVITTASSLGRVPGGASMPTADPGHLPGPLLRNPHQILQRSLSDVEKTRNMHEELLGRLRASEAELDLDSATIVVEEIKVIYTGASEVAAQYRDRLHRLEFYVSRIGTPTKLLEQLSDQLVVSKLPHDLHEIEAFVQLCNERSRLEQPRPAPGHSPKGGVRGLLDTLEQLLEEFPHTAATAGESAATLRAAMREVTELAWEHVEEAKTKLACIPVPIRPVQNLLNRIDGIRMLEVFLDLEDRSRAALYDEIERVRMRLDQARMTRDNIARGAQEAMNRGHLTTALYEMQRAVGEGSATDPQLIANLEHAKQLREELDHTIAENHRLTAKYIELVDAEHSTVAERVDALDARSSALRRLIDTLGPEKAAHYTSDLKEVIENLIQEHADQGEAELTDATTPEDRCLVIKSTLANLIAVTAEASVASQTSGRTRRVLDVWRHKQAEAEEQLVAAQVQRHRNLQMKIAIPAIVLILITTIVIAFRSGGTSLAAEKIEFHTPEQRLKVRDGVPIYGFGEASVELIKFVTRLESSKNVELQSLDLPKAANDIATHLNGFGATSSGVWFERLLGLLTNLDTGLGQLQPREPTQKAVHEELIEFGRYAHLAGISLMIVSTNPNRSTYDRLIKTLPHLPRLRVDPAELARIRELLR